MGNPSDTQRPAPEAPGPALEVRSARRRRSLWRRGRGGLIAAALAAALVVAGCGSGDDDDPADEVKPELTIGIDSGLSGFSPAVSQGEAGRMISYLAFEPLIQQNPQDGSYEPGLAETFEYVGEGNTTYRFTLREGVRFSDGEELDADAVKSWLTYFPEGGSAFGSMLAIESIETPDPLTVVLHLAKPSPLVTEFLAGPWGQIASPRAVADPESFSTATAGAGPYSIDPSRTVSGTSATYTFVPNEHYYDQDRIKWTTISAKVVEDPGTTLRSMTSGEIDVALGNVATAEAAHDAGLHVTTAQAGTNAIVLMDRDGSMVPALGDVRVRQALNYAIDREPIASSLFGALAESTSQIRTSDGWVDALQDHYPFDAEKAKKLLADAGFSDGFSFDVTTQGFGGAYGRPISEAVAQDLAEVGVTMDVKASTTQSDFLAKATTRPAVQYSPVFQPMLMDAMSWWAEGAFLNPFGAVNAEMDDLISRAQTADAAEKAEIFAEMSRVSVEQALLIPIVTRPNILYATDEVGGVQASAWQFYSSMVLDWSPAS